MLEGESKSYEINGSAGYSLGSFLDRLTMGSFNYEKGHFELLIDPRQNPITPRDIERLANLPFEVSLSEYQGLILVVTGVTGTIPWRSERHKESVLHSRFSGHSHPIRNNDQESYDSPSIGDMLVAHTMAPDTYPFIAHRTGITVFRAPTRHPLTLAPLSKQLTAEEMYNLFEAYINRQKVSATIPTRQGFRSHHTLPWRDRAQLQRSFAAACGAIVEEAGWGERARLSTILRPINAGPRS